MYDDDYKNPAHTNLKDLENFLQLIADLDEDIELFAIGGTAMVLENIKESTKDIDFLTTLDYESLKRMFELAGLEEKETNRLCNIWFLDGKIRIDLFYDAHLMGITLDDDWKSTSKEVRSIGKLRLYILNWYDIIITKIARSETRDIDDVLEIIKAVKIDLAKLKERYYKSTEDTIVRDYDAHFKNFERRLKE